MRLPRPKGFLSVDNLAAAAPGGKTSVLRSVSFSLGA